MDLKIDKQNGKVAYNDLAHKYWNVDNNSKYISVTTLIGKFEQPYDKEFWSKYKALERLMDPNDWKNEKKAILETHKFRKELLESYDISEKEWLATQQDILDEWDITNRESCERGTKIHADLENSFYKTKHNISLSKYEIGGKFECVKDRTELDLENGIYPEYLISWEDIDGTIKLAGQIDGLIIKGKSIIILDWKGLALDTEILTTKGFKQMKDITLDDILYDRDMCETKILHKSEIHHNPCYKLTFECPGFFKRDVIADHEHRWVVKEKGVLTTEELKEGMLIPCARGVCTISHIEQVETVPTQCLEVDSPTHTFLITRDLIVTHNTNKEIKTKSYFDTKSKKSTMMKYPLNNLQDCHYYHYNMQLSTYAWMMLKKLPGYTIEDLVLVHFDHNDKMTVYHLPYLEKEVERMLKFYKREVKKQLMNERVTPIVY